MSGSPSGSSDLRLSVRPSVTVFLTFLLHALTYWAEILYVTFCLWTFDQVHVSSIFVGVMPLLEAKSRKYQWVFEVKSRVKTWQVRGIWSQQLEYKQVPKRGTEPSVRKGKRSLLASNISCKCTLETTQNSVKVKHSINVMKFVENLIGWEVTVG